MYFLIMNQVCRLFFGFLDSSSSRELFEAKLYILEYDTTSSQALI